MTGPELREWRRELGVTGNHPELLKALNIGEQVRAAIEAGRVPMPEGFEDQYRTAVSRIARAKVDSLAVA